jgi:TetR/AcrR family transcriptional repressor of nem operon
MTGYITFMARASVREQLLDSAVGTFRRRGVQGASVSELAADAGVPKGSVYNHFEDKEALACEVLQRYVAGQGRSALRGAGSAVERLRAHVAHQIARTEASGVTSGCLLGNFASELSGDAYPRLREEVSGAFGEWTDAIADAIAEGQASGEIRSARTPHDLAAWLIASLEGATAYAKATNDLSALNTFVSVAFDTVIA